MKTRNEHLQHTTDNIRALTQGISTTTPTDRAPGKGADGISRAKPETITWRLNHPPLLHQLTAALTPTGGVSGDNPSRPRPGSRPPTNTTASNALHDLTHGWQVSRDDSDRQPGILTHRHQLRAAARATTPPRPGLVGALHDIRALTHILPDPWPEVTARHSRAWVVRARAALALDAPVATLADVGCPHCRTPLRVRSDASSDVWCPNPGCRSIDGDRHRWARAEWPFLLEQLTGKDEGAA